MPNRLDCRRAWVALGAGLVLTSLSEAQFPAAHPAYQSGFPVVLSPGHVSSSSVNLAELDPGGGLEVVVGASDGKVYAYTGFGVKLWEFDTGNTGIEGKAAIADIDGNGFNEVVVGAGSTLTPGTSGGLYVLSHLGQLQCSVAIPAGVFSSPALADLDGNDGGLLEIAFGSWDRNVRVLNHDCTEVWKKFVVDTVWSSPAIGDVNRDGRLDVVIGVDSDDQFPAPERPEGGELHVFDGPSGAELAGFPLEIDEVIWSSPGLADLAGDSGLEIAVGTGYCWANPACAPDGVNPDVGEYLNAWDRNGTYLPGWPVVTVNQYAFASPALADLDDDGEPEVVINTINPADMNGGLIYALNGDGTSVPGWPVRPTLPATPTTLIHFSTSASPIVADITGDGNLEVILPSNWDLVVFDKDGRQLSRDSFPTGTGDFELMTNGPIGSSAAVGDIDGDGDLEVVVGSYFSVADGRGAIYAWDFNAPASAKTPWPMFRRSSDNQAQADGLIFTDGFESGNTSVWSFSAP